jgi:hypothetical protein
VVCQTKYRNGANSDPVGERQMKWTAEALLPIQTIFPTCSQTTNHLYPTQSLPLHGANIRPVLADTTPI